MLKINNKLAKDVNVSIGTGELTKNDNSAIDKVYYIQNSLTSDKVNYQSKRISINTIWISISGYIKNLGVVLTFENLPYEIFSMEIDEKIIINNFKDINIDFLVNEEKKGWLPIIPKINDENNMIHLSVKKIMVDVIMVEFDINITSDDSEYKNDTKICFKDKIDLVNQKP